MKIKLRLKYRRAAPNKGRAGRHTDNTGVANPTRRKRGNTKAPTAKMGHN